MLVQEVEKNMRCRSIMVPQILDQLVRNIALQEIVNQKD